MKIYFFKLNKKNIIIALLVLLIVMLLILFQLFGKSSQVFYQINNPIYQGNQDKPYIAFACNVVWGTEYIPDMLEIFRNNNVKITFFIGGEWAKQNPDILKKISDDGHELGNHGYSHQKHSKLTKDQNIEEIIKTEQIIKKITGVATNLFAPPYGDYNKLTVTTADELGYKTIMWTIDTIDWRREGKDIIIERVLKNPQNGSIVLMHPTQYTIEALPYIIQQLNNKGYKVVTVSDVID